MHQGYKSMDICPSGMSLVECHRALPLGCNETTGPQVVRAAAMPGAGGRVALQVTCGGSKKLGHILQCDI